MEIIYGNRSKIDQESAAVRDALRSGELTLVVAGRTGDDSLGYAVLMNPAMPLPELCLRLLELGVNLRDAQ